MRNKNCKYPVSLIEQRSRQLHQNKNNLNSTVGFYKLYQFVKVLSCIINRMSSDNKSGGGGDRERGGSGSGGGSGGDQNKERKRKESIVDLARYLEKNIRVKFAGGREAAGILKGFDPLLNLVLDDTVEFLRDPDDPMKLTEDRRSLGLVVCRGTSVVLICPADGMEQIPNPFVQQDA